MSTSHPADREGQAGRGDRVDSADRDQEARLGPSTGTGFDWLGGVSSEWSDERPPAEQAPAPVAGTAEHPTTADTAAETPAEPAPADRHDGMLVLGTLTPVAEVPPAEPTRACRACGDVVDSDGYCQGCGLRAPTPQEYRELALTPALAAVCDQGVRHTSNEDAFALAGDPAADLAVLVVCDGVSTAPHSARASQAAAEAAVAALHEPAVGTDGADAGTADADARLMTAATDAAAAAVRDVTQELAEQGQLGRGEPACTFVAALVRGGRVTVGNVGDSRAYWVGDDGRAAVLSSDDSWAAERMRAGASREEAENGPQAHTLTRWLGTDAPEHTPHLCTVEGVATLTSGGDGAAAGPGWLIVCSDGLWNYVSEAQDLARLVLEDDRHAEAAEAREAVGEREAVELARTLTQWAISQGGHDNITVAVARLGAGEPTTGERS